MNINKIKSRTYNISKPIFAIICGIVILIGAYHWWQQNRKNENEIYQKKQNEFYLKKLIERADNGDAKAQYELGNFFHYGYGVCRDDDLAAIWWMEAAKQGLAEAQNNLGSCYSYGWGVYLDYKESVKWFRKAAEQGLAEAQNNLGFCYENGFGVIQNDYEAVKWYRKAAEQGHKHAIQKLQQHRTKSFKKHK